MTVLAVVEGAARIYEIGNPLCKFLDKDVFAETPKELANQMCRDLNSIMYKQDDIKLLVPDQHKTTLNINSDGLRGEEILEKQDEYYRIIMMGGSTVFGYGATSDDTTIPSLLEKKFKKSEAKVEVINAGISEATSLSETYLIKKKLIRMEPDLFIVYDGWNDAIYDNTVVSKISEKKETAIDKLIDLIKNYPIYRTPFVIKHLLFSEEKDIPNSELTEKKILLWNERWAGVCRLGQSENFKVIIFVQPMLGTSNKVMSIDEKKLLEQHKESLEVIHQVLDGFASSDQLRENCVDLIDLRNVFENTSRPIFFDRGHMSDYGNEIMAQKMFEDIYPIVKNAKK